MLMGWRRRRGWWGCPLLTPRVTPGVAIATHRVPISITNMMHMVPGHSCHSSNWSSNPAARGGLGSALCKNKVNNYWVFKTKPLEGIRYVLFSVIQRSSSSGTFHILLEIFAYFIRNTTTLIEILWSNLTLEQNSSRIWLSAGTPMLVLSRP